MLAMQSLTAYGSRTGSGHVCWQAARMRGFGEQVLHYFDRPAGSRPLGSVGGPAAWTGETVGDPWRDALTAEQVDELGAAVTSVVASGVDLGTLSADDVALASLDNDIQRWRHELAEGRGFVLVQ